MADEQERYRRRQQILDDWSRMMDECADDIRATVAIYGRQDDMLVKNRTGVLLAVGQRHLILTAAHDLEEFSQHKIPLYAAPTSPGSFPVPLDVTVRGNKAMDIAIMELSDSVVGQLVPRRKFLRMTDVDVSRETPKGFYVVIGYPNSPEYNQVDLTLTRKRVSWKGEEYVVWDNRVRNDHNVVREPGHLPEPFLGHSSPVLRDMYIRSPPSAAGRNDPCAFGPNCLHLGRNVEILINRQRTAYVKRNLCVIVVHVPACPIVRMVEHRIIQKGRTGDHRLILPSVRRNIRGSASSSRRTGNIQRLHERNVQPQPDTNDSGGDHVSEQVLRNLLQSYCEGDQDEELAESQVAGNKDIRCHP